MKKFLNFLKRKWFLLTLFFIGIVLLCLGTITVYCLLGACVIFSIICFYFARKLQLKYNEIIDSDPQEDYFDATKLDYDEEIYYVGTSNAKKAVSKNFFGKLSTKTPAIALYILATALLTLPLFTIIKGLLF